MGDIPRERLVYKKALLSALSLKYLPVRDHLEVLEPLISGLHLRSLRVEELVLVSDNRLGEEYSARKHESIFKDKSGLEQLVLVLWHACQELQRLEVSGRPGQLPLPINELVSKYVPNITTLCIKWVAFEYDRLSFERLRNLEIRRVTWRNISTQWVREWGEVLRNVVELEQLVIEDSTTEEGPWKQAYLALTGIERNNTADAPLVVLEDLKVRAPKLRALQLHTATTYMALTFMALLSRTNLSTLSLWVKVTTGDMILTQIGRCWPRLQVLALNLELFPTEQPRRLFRTLTRLKVLEWNENDIIKHLLLDPEPIILPRLKTLRVHTVVLVRSGREHNILDLLSADVWQETAVKKVLFDKAHVLGQLRNCRVQTEDLGQLRVGWFKPCNGFQELREDLEPSWRVYSQSELKEKAFGLRGWQDATSTLGEDTDDESEETPNDATAGHEWARRSSLWSSSRSVRDAVYYG
ncbi:hypothetical protein CALCODRAFT_354858 [Calocera cornea HHB12733]|uniref:F-box domain-containing protein n=1 Tax=Calocera cornea HHB12733 TaxID=1353952 RepID=A0A165ERB8_9BASI|nr:hypothetical protein CALCODRAFT_354858 [Calocera cornea HHB12733]